MSKNYGMGEIINPVQCKNDPVRKNRVVSFLIENKGQKLAPMLIP